jgi:hypothetical protein
VTLGRQDRINESQELLSHKEEKQKYLATPEGLMGYMFQFKFHGTKMWRDATEEVIGLGRLINHSKCHNNVSGRDIKLRLLTNEAFCECILLTSETKCCMQMQN